MRKPRAWCSVFVLTCVWQGTLAQAMLKSNASVRLATASTSPKCNRAANPRLPEPPEVGIREEIPEKYRKRYEEWKGVFLSTETGRRQWRAYAESTGFLLTITMARENRNGAATGEYEWDDSGKLVAATIVLGAALDHGYPNPIYYPVQNSLSPFGSSDAIDGGILAATKLAHEFGHVNRMGVTNSETYRTQMRLIPVYNSILLRNGYNPTDPRLAALAREMGGTPVELWEDREYWGEANAMLFLRDLSAKESFRCMLFRRIEKSVRLYAKNYEDRFMQIAQTTSPSESCGW